MAKKAKAAAPPLDPADIRRIRESLGLTQVEAGELLGGGIRAFQKYESGSIVPSATTMNLLRVLDADPTALVALSGSPVPIQQSGLRPFEVTGAHIGALTDRYMVVLTRRLLTAESATHLLPPDQIHVASNLTAPDGGEDARITWTAGPERTNYLPSRDCLLQVKAAAVSPSGAAKDVLTGKGELEPAIREVLEGGGNYIMLCNRPYTRRQVGERIVAIRDAIVKSGVAVKASQIAFRDADQLASWVNEHPNVATWVLEQTQPGLATTLHSWGHWVRRHEHEHPYIDDDRLGEVRAKVRLAAQAEREVVRVVGLSGVGKSRLVMEAFSNDEEVAIQASDLVLYGVETEVGAVAVKGVVQLLADLGRRAVIVIDRCTEETHVDLAAMVRRSSSKLSLITIDHEIPRALAGDTIVVPPAEAKVVEAVIRSISPALPPEDVRRLVSFSGGFPQMAVWAAEAWASGAPLSGVTKDYLIDQVVVGRGITDRKEMLQAAKLLSAFGMLGFRDELAGELGVVARFAGGLTEAQLRANLVDLNRRRVVQARGRFATIQPRPIAHNLGERQWEEWSTDQWDEILTRLPQALRERAARQLAQLNRSPIALSVSRHLCRVGGPLDSFDALLDEGNASVIDDLAQIDAYAAGELLTRIFDVLTPDELRQLDGQARAEIRWAAERIAFLPETFDVGANLLLRLALAENEKYSNNSSGQFKQLFPAYLADTAADGNARLSYLDDLIARNDPELQELLIGALESGAEVQQFSRSVGIESHGMRPAIQPWHPTGQEAREYIGACLGRLLIFALRGDRSGEIARQKLAPNLRTLILNGFIDFVEEAVDQLTAKFGALWPAALATLGDVITFDLGHFPPGIEERVRSLIAKVSPNDLSSRIKLLVTEMPWDYPCDEKISFENRGEKQRAAIYEVAVDALKEPETLQSVLVDLCVGDQRMAGLFGTALAELADNKLGWLWRILRAYSSLPVDSWNADLLTSYFAALNGSKPRLVETFKRLMIRSPKMAWVVPILSFKLDIPASDILLIRDALRAGKLTARTMQLWTVGGRLARRTPAEVVPLFDEIFSDPKLAGFGFDLIGMYVHGDRERLEELRPQLRLAAENAMSDSSTSLNDHHFNELMTWMLDHGREDADARTVALTLARHLVSASQASSLSRETRIRSILPLLLREFPEVVWPLISSAIISDRRAAWRFQMVLGKGCSFGSESNDAPILALTEDTLLAWCHAHPEVAPAFLAAILPPLAGGVFHPTLRRIIDEFGERSAVQSALAANMNTFGWSGSIANYYELYREPLASLQTHTKVAVRQWARKMSQQIEKQITRELQTDDEHDAHYE